MKLRFRILTIVLSLALLLGSMSVFTVFAATTITPTSVLQADTANGNDWRIWLNVDGTIPDGTYFGQDSVPVVLTDKDGKVLGKSEDGSLFASFFHDGKYLMPMVYGGADRYAANNAPKDGDTIVLSAGTYAASDTANSIVIEKDVKLVYSNGTFVLAYTMSNAYALEELVVLSGASNATCIYVGIAANAPLTFSTDWTNRFFAADPLSGVFFTHAGTTTQVYSDGNAAKGLPVEDYTEGAAGIGGGIYFNGFDTAVAGDTLTFKGDWHSPSTGEEISVVGEFVFTFDGTAWTMTHNAPEEEDTSVKLTHLDLIAAHQSATAFYTQLPTTEGLTVDNSWATRFFPMTSEDGAFFNGTAFELDAGGGMPIQSAAGAPGFYVTGFGTAVAGDKVVLKGRFYSKNRDTQEKNGETITFVAPVEFTFDGTKWARTSAIPEVEITYENEFTGTFTNAGSQVVAGTNPDQLYLKGSDGLAGAFAGKYTDNEWNQASLIASGEDSGFFLNGTKVAVALQQYSYSQNFYFASGMNATNAGDILTAKGVFTNQDFSTKLNIEECHFIWDGTKWADYVPGTEVTYNDIRLDSVYSASHTDHWRFNFNVNGNWPAGEDFEDYTNLRVFVNDVEMNAGSISTHKNGNYLLMTVWGTVGATAPVKGDKLTVKAGKAEMKSDTTVGINLTEDFTVYYNGTEWSSEEPLPEYTYHDFAVSGIQQVLHTYEADGTTIKYRHFYLNVNGTVPGDWDKFQGLQIAVNDGAKETILVGNAGSGSTGVIVFDVHSSQMAADIAAGTTLTLYAGYAPAVEGAANVSADNAIRLTADYTLTWNGTAWEGEAQGGGEDDDDEIDDTIDYVGVEIAGVHENTNLNGGANWHIYLNTTAAMPGESWGNVDGTPIHWNQKVVIDGTAYTVSAKKWDTNGLFIEFPLSYLSDAASHTITLLGGKYTSNVGKLGYELLGDIELFGDGSSWSLEAQEDTTDYAQIVGSGVTNDTTLHSSGLWFIYITLSDEMQGENWEVINNTQVKYPQVVEIDGVTYTITAKKAGPQTLFIEFPNDYLSDAAEHTLTLKAGKYKSNIGDYAYQLTDDFKLNGDGTSWSVPASGMFDTLTFNGASYGWNADQGYWDIHYQTKVAIPGTDWVTIFNGLIVEIDGVPVDAIVKKAASQTLNVFYIGAAPQVGTKVVIKPSQAVASDYGVNGIEVLEEYEMYWDGEKMVAVTFDDTVYNDMHVSNLVSFSTDAGDWRFNLTIDGGWPTVEGNLPKLTDLSVYINETKLSSALIDLYKNGDYLMVSLWGDLTNNVVPVEGDKVTIKLGQARFEGTKWGINLTRDAVLVYDGEKWALEGVVDNHTYTDITLELPVYPSGYSEEKGRWDMYFPVTGNAIPGAADAGNDSAFDYVRVSVTNSANQPILTKGSFRAWKAAYMDGSFYFAIDKAYLPIEKLDKGSVMTVHAGKLGSPVNENGINIVKDIQFKWTGATWMAMDYDSLKPSETNIKLSIDRASAYGGNCNGVYLLTDDHFPVDGGWSVRIPAATYDDYSGVYLNGELLANVTICRFAEGRLYIALLDAGYVAKDKDKLVIRGMFRLDNYGVSYKEYTVYFNGKHWNEQYEPAPEETYTQFSVEKVNGMVTSYSTKGNQWNVYLTLDTMIPGDVDTMSFNGMRIVGSDGKERDVYVSHSWNHHLYVAIPDEVLPLQSKDGDYVILKAGKALSPQDQCSGIELMEDVKLYYYKGGISELEPTDDTLFEDVTITRMNQASRFDPATGEWRFHWVIASALENVENGVTFSDFPMEINGVTHKVRVLRDGNYLYIRVPESALPGDTQSGVISVKAGVQGFANSGHNGIQLTNDWTAYIFRGVIGETEYTEPTLQEFGITGVQAATFGTDRVHFYLRTNREIPGTEWYEPYAGFTYYYNGQKVTTTAFKPGSSNNKFIYIPAVYKEIGIDAPQEGDTITIPSGSFGDGGGYQIQTNNEFTLIFSGGVWTQYIEHNVTPPAAVEGSIWEHFRFEEGYIPMLQDDNKTLWSNEDEFHDIVSIEKHKDYTFNIEVKKLYDDETTPPFYVILRGNAVSEEDKMTAEMLYGYVVQFSAAEIADPNDPEKRIWSQYISLWKNGVNGALIDQYRVNYVHSQTDHPFFQYDATHNYELSVYNINETTACITVKVDGQLVLRYYDVSSGLDPMDPAVNDGLFVVSASCPGLISGEAVDLGELMVETSECETNDRVRVAVTYPSTLEGAVFTVDGEGATIKNGVFTATKPGTYTIRATYNGKDYGSKTILVKEPPKRELLDVGGDKTEFPWLIVGIAGGVVVVAALVVLFILLAKRKKKAATPAAE